MADKREDALCEKCRTERILFGKMWAQRCSACGHWLEEEYELTYCYPCAKLRNRCTWCGRPK